MTIIQILKRLRQKPKPSTLKELYVAIGCCIVDEGLMLRIRMGIMYSKLFW